jgi:hypothetical protein
MNVLQKAKQWPPLGYKAAQVPGPEYQQETNMGPMGRDCKPKEGENPMKSMMDGPFGGKKPGA